MNKFKDINFYENGNQFELHKDIEPKLIWGNLSTQAPKYSIVITTYRRALLLEEALLSAINQKKIKDYEIVIVEHGQIDDSTEKMLNKYKKYNNICFYQLENWVETANWTKGFEKARGQWVTLLCDDDLLLPNYLYTVDEILKINPEIEGLAPMHSYFYYDMGNHKIISHPDISYFANSLFNKIKFFFKDIFKLNKYHIGSYIVDNYYTLNGSGNPTAVTYDRKKLLAMGGMNLKTKHIADIILNFNYMLRHNMFYTTEVLGKRREWKGSASAIKNTKIETVALLYNFYKTLHDKLKVLSFDTKYTQLMTVNELINAQKLNYEDIKEYNLEIPEEYFTKAELTKFKAMREAYLKKLAEANPPLLKYSYTLCNNFRLEKFDNSKIEKGVNIYVDFIDYLKKKKAQQKIDSFAKKYKGKKIVLYGAGIFTDAIIQNYNLSDLDIIAIADIKFDGKSKLHDYPIIDPESLKNMDFDVLMISMHKDYIARKFFKNKLFKNSKPKFKIDSLIKMSLKDRCADLSF